MAASSRERSTRERPSRYQATGGDDQERSASGRRVWGSRQREEEWPSGPQCYIVPGRGLPMHTHTHTHRSSTTEATATDDPGLFVLAPARRRRPAQSGEGSLVEVQYKSCACISPFYPGTAVGGAESLSLSLSPPCAPLCFGRWRPLRLECNRGAASFDVIMHLAGVARDADPFALHSRREPALPRRARAGDWKGEGVPRAAAGAASGLSLGRR